MEQERIVLITTKKEFKSWMDEEIHAKSEEFKQPDVENDRISKHQAAKLIGKSIPTLNRLINEGILKVYGFGKRGKFLLRSEILEAIRNSNL